MNTVLHTAIIHARPGRAAVLVKFPEQGIETEFGTKGEAVHVLERDGYEACHSGAKATFEHNDLWLYAKEVEANKAQHLLPDVPSFAVKLHAFRPLLSAIFKPEVTVRAACNPNIERLVYKASDQPDFSRLGGSIYAVFTDVSSRRATLEELGSAYVVLKPRRN